MKKPLVDVKERQLSEYKAKVQYINKFIKNWGKTTVGGVEVLRERNHIYPMSAQAEKFLRWSGGLDSVRNQRWKGIKNAWIYINPSKDQELSKELVAANLTLAATRAPDDFQFRVGIPLEGGTGKLILAASEAFKSHKNIDRYKAELKAELKARKVEIATNFTPRAKYADPWVTTLAQYVVLYGDYEIQTIGTGVDQDIRQGRDWTGEIYSYVVNVPILSLTFTSVLNSYDENHPVVVAAIAGKNRIVDSYPEEGTGDGSYGGWWSGYSRPAPTIPSIWVQSGGYYYLRTSFLKSGIVPDTGAYIKLEDRLELLSASGFVDSDYEEKSCDFWCSITTVVIVVIAVVAAVYTGGKSLKAGAALITAVATAVVTFAAVIAISAAVLDGTGDVVTARGLNRLNKTIAPLVAVASVILVIDFMTTAYNSMASAASNLADDAAMATLESSSQFAGMSSTWTSAGASAASRFTNTLADNVVKSVVSSISKTGWEQGLKWVNQVAGIIKKNELEKLEGRLKSQQEQLAQQQQAMEESDSGNPAMDYQINYTNVMLLDWSGYGEFERRYSGYQPRYGGGNVQRTEVCALMGMGTNTYFRQGLVEQVNNV